MKPVSLKRRFFFNTAFVLITVMVISALLVDSRFRKEIEQSNQDKMKLHIFTLLSVTEHKNNSLNLPVLLQNPRFNNADSGLVAWVLDNESSVLWQSLSLDATPPAVMLSDETGQWSFSRAMLESALYDIVDYKIAWDSNGKRDDFHFIVAKNSTDLNEQIENFRTQNFFSFFLVTASLLLCQFMVLRFAFKPIGRMEQEIEQMEKGQKGMLSANYPQELQGVSTNLNALIDKEYRQREKYRTNMADLAHSIKTPIAIINTELEEYTSNDALQNALSRVNQTIEYQLRRAVISGHSLLNSGAQVSSIFDMVATAMTKVYRDSRISVSADFDESAMFYGDENDLLEVFGNLLDNSYKYASSAIKVSSRNKNNSLQLVIEDDGCGFSRQQVERIFTRGERLDRKNLGQGIGLAIVVDIVNSYDGSISASTSDMGGARFDLSFPLKD